MVAERWGRGPALAVAALALLYAAVGGWIYTRHASAGFVPLRLAGNALDTDAPVWPARSVLGWDLRLIACYCGPIVLAGWLGRKVFVTPAGQALAGLTIGLGALAGVLGLAANRCAGAADGWWTEQPAGAATAWANAAQGTAFATLMVLVVAVPLAAGALAVTVLRWASSAGRRRRPEMSVGDVRRGPMDTAGQDAEHAAWAADWALPDGRSRGDFGICVSGGGVRSAAFALGALQAVQQAKQLKQARYLVAVSGGAYAAGAMRLAIQPTKKGVPSAATAGDAFAMGSPEFDHVRHNSRYLADGAQGWLRALAVMLRGLLATQLVLLLGVVLAARAAGELYRRVPALGHLLEPRSRIPVGIGWAMAAPFLVALALWLTNVMAENSRRLAGAEQRVRPVLRYVLWCLIVAGLAMLVAGLLIPLLASATTKALELHQASGARQATTGAAAALTTGYVATIAGVFLTTGRVAGSVASWVRRNDTAIGRLPSTLLQRVLVVLGVTVFLVVHAFVFAQVTHAVATAAPGRLHAALGWPMLGLAGLLGGLALCVDQTRWSLHPFYKERLATAFAVRRKRADQTHESDPYDWDELTELRSHCSWTRDGGFPQVIFQAAANVSGQQSAHLGRKVLPYTMSGDWIGSPRLGWIRTGPLTEHVPHPLRADLTTQAAMAISGAAFASATGASGTPFSLLFALTNARLGTWLPNPIALHRTVASAGRPDQWCHAALPRWRRLHYLAREIFGICPVDSQLLLLTDGGQYEQLGLVELLRHAPLQVFCFDAGGGDPLTAGGLGPAIALARGELGIRIVIDEGSPDAPAGLAALRPGSAPGPTGPDQPADPLASRLARSNVLTATIHYPAGRPRGAPATGRLYYGRAVLTPDTPWEILAHATRRPTFPNDSTSDQWFDQERFDAYHGLGRHVGEAVLAAAPDRETTSPSTGVHDDTWHRLQKSQTGRHAFANSRDPSGSGGG